MNAYTNDITIYLSYKWIIMASIKLDIAIPFNDDPPMSGGLFFYFPLYTT